MRSAMYTDGRALAVAGGSRLPRLGDMFVAQQNRETFDRG